MFKLKLDVASILLKKYSVLYKYRTSEVVARMVTVVDSTLSFTFFLLKQSMFQEKYYSSVDNTLSKITSHLNYTGSKLTRISGPVIWGLTHFWVKPARNPSRNMGPDPFLGQDDSESGSNWPEKGSDNEGHAEFNF